MTITIILLIIIALGFIIYKNYSAGKLSDLNDSKKTEIIVKNFMSKMIYLSNESAQISLKVMKDLSITDAKYRIFAANVVDRDSFKIDQMKGLYTQYLGDDYSTASSTYKNIMKNMADLKGDDLSKVYVKEMIKHHDKAINIAKDYIKLIDKIQKSNSHTENGLTITSSNPIMNDSYSIAVDIINNYQKDIEELKKN